MGCGNAALPRFIDGFEFFKLVYFTNDKYLLIMGKNEYNV